MSNLGSLFVSIFVIVMTTCVICMVLGAAITANKLKKDAHSRIEQVDSNDWVNECIKDNTSFWHEKDKKYYNITYEVSKQACQDAWPFRKQQ